MGNAHENVKAIAGKLDIRRSNRMKSGGRKVINGSCLFIIPDLTTETNEEDGVAVVLEKIVQL